MHKMKVPSKKTIKILSDYLNKNPSVFGKLTVWFANSGVSELMESSVTQYAKSYSNKTIDKEEQVSHN